MPDEATWDEWQVRAPEDRITLAAFRKYAHRAYDRGYSDGVRDGRDEERAQWLAGARAKKTSGLRKADTEAAEPEASPAGGKGGE